MEKLPLTAIVVCYNEAHFLAASLAGLSFCDELLVVDLGSSDESVAVARACGATVLTHEWVPVGEQALAAILPMTRHEWLLRADPDEVFTPVLAERIGSLLPDISDNVAAIALPYRHYFLGRPVNHTSWALLNGHMVKMYRKDRMRVTGHIHHGILIPEDNEMAFINLEPEDRIQHFTAISVRNRVDKTIRYTRIEGEARYARGMRFRVIEMLVMPLRILWRELYIYQGWRDGYTGITIAIMQAVYELLSWLSLRRWQRSQPDYRQ